MLPFGRRGCRSGRCPGAWRRLSIAPIAPLLLRRLLRLLLVIVVAGRLCWLCLRLLPLPLLPGLPLGRLCTPHLLHHIHTPVRKI